MQGIFVKNDGTEVSVFPVNDNQTKQEVLQAINQIKAGNL